MIIKNQAKEKIKVVNLPLYQILHQISIHNIEILIDKTLFLIMQRIKNKNQFSDKNSRNKEVKVSTCLKMTCVSLNMLIKCQIYQFKNY